MVTVARFSRNIRSRNSQIQNAGTRATKMVAKRALRALVEATPVDVGTARSNWRVGIGNPTRSVIEAYAPGKKLGRGERANAAAAISVGIGRIESVRGGPRGLTTAIYITNAVPYIELLNAGRSKQSSPGWIEGALQEASSLQGFRVFELGGGDDD